MIKYWNIIASRKPALWLGAAALSIAPALCAHGGFRHVMGTVAKVSDNRLTVKTAKGNVDVKLSDKTEFEGNDRKAQIRDLKPGTRVVAEVPEGSADNVAQSIKIGAPARRSHAAHK